MAATVRFLSERGIPVCAHVGLMPQMIKKLGGYKVQGKEEKSAAKVKSDAIALQQAGADIIILDSSPPLWAKKLALTYIFRQSALAAGLTATGKCWYYTTCWD